jgi:hypothetical protein
MRRSISVGISLPCLPRRVPFTEAMWRNTSSTVISKIRSSETVDHKGSSLPCEVRDQDITPPDNDPDPPEDRK